jgi:hypothetical protein
VFRSEGLSLGFFLGLFGFNLFFSHVVVQVVAVHGDLDGSSTFILSFLNLNIFVLFFAVKIVVFSVFLLVLVSLNFSVDLFNETLLFLCSNFSLLRSDVFSQSILDGVV